MPPRTKISRDMIIDAAFELTRENGIDNVNARTVSERLHCSTQPVMYCFKTIDELKTAVYERVDQYQSERLMNVDDENPMMSIGINYIRFAIEEKNFFKLLFQTNGLAQKEMDAIISTDALQPIIEVLKNEVGVEEEGARDIFAMLAYFSHGYASLLANNSIRYDEDAAIRLLEGLFNGACTAEVMKKEQKSSNKTISREEELC